MLSRSRFDGARYKSAALLRVYLLLVANATFALLVNAIASTDRLPPANHLHCSIQVCRRQSNKRARMDMDTSATLHAAKVG